jgi:hypothetical protein
VHQRDPLHASLEASFLRAVRRAYGDLNETFFKGRLRRPPLELSETTGRLGRWVNAPRRIEIARSLIATDGWGVVIEVLKHEMAHQYVDEVLRETEESAHGPSFRRVCEERGIDGRAVGMPSAGNAAAPGPMLDRIAKLLALAESANEHEARAAMAAAQRLMLKYNLEEVGEASAPGYGFRHLGRATGRVSEAERGLAGILSQHFFVDAIWVPVFRPLDAMRGTVLEICGRTENLEMAEYVYSFLMHTSERLWRAHKKETGIRLNRDRRAYLAGVMAGFQAQLDEQARANEAAGLVWVGDAGLGEYFKKRHPRIRWTRHASSRGNTAHARGVDAGRQIVLHRGVEGRASGNVRLLTRATR